MLCTDLHVGTRSRPDLSGKVRSSRDCACAMRQRRSLPRLYPHWPYSQNPTHKACGPGVASKQTMPYVFATWSFSLTDPLRLWLLRLWLSKLNKVQWWSGLAHTSGVKMAYETHERCTDAHILIPSECEAGRSVPAISGTTLWSWGRKTDQKCNWRCIARGFVCAHCGALSQIPPQVWRAPPPRASLALPLPGTETDTSRDGEQTVKFI